MCLKRLNSMTSMEQRMPIIYLIVLTSTVLFSGCASAAPSLLVPPLPNAQLRSTPLYFGLHVTPDPAHNPIRPPERFEGYHSATDYEVTQKELNVDVPVYAACSGKIAYAGFAEGYGGVITEYCTLGGSGVTIIYGHLTISGMPKQGTEVAAGDRIAILAPAKSHDSDGNRKHLHFGIRLGQGSDMRGYVQSESELTEYLDPQKFLPPFGGQHTGGLLLAPYWATPLTGS